MNKTLTGAAVAASVTIASATGAFAQACVDADTAATTLEQGYGETVVRATPETLTDQSTGEALEVVRELWADDNDGSWTAIALIESEGIRCQAGEGFGYPENAPTPDEW